jgi:hypothetical protein
MKVTSSVFSSSVAFWIPAYVATTARAIKMPWKTRDAVVAAAAAFPSRGGELARRWVNMTRSCGARVR